MSDRFDLEFQRLFGLDRAGSLIDFRGHTRALVLEWPAPADWERLGAVWRGVQDALGWPAPAIAVSGEALQLWFSLAEPVDASAAHTLLGALCARFLPAAQQSRVAHWPRDERHVARPGVPVPGDERWSAFVAADLAPLFAQTPWLDVPPGDDGQAALLAELGSVPPERWAPLLASAPHSGTPTRPDADPRAFLSQVMSDASVPLALRIEAAKALLMAPPGR